MAAKRRSFDSRNPHGRQTPSGSAALFGFLKCRVKGMSLRRYALNGLLVGLCLFGLAFAVDALVSPSRDVDLQGILSFLVSTVLLSSLFGVLYGMLRRRTSASSRPWNPKSLSRRRVVITNGAVYSVVGFVFGIQFPVTLVIHLLIGLATGGTFAAVTYFAFTRRENSERAKR